LFYSELILHDGFAFTLVDQNGGELPLIRL